MPLLFTNTAEHALTRQCDPPLRINRTSTMKFAANLSTLCNDIPKLTERFAHIMSRKDYNFTYVECQNPYEVPIDEWKTLTNKHSAKWVLINTPPLFANWQANDLPSDDEYKSLILDKAFEYASQLSIPIVHLVMSDIVDEPSQDAGKRSLKMTRMVELLNFAARIAEPLGITCVIEPLCIRDSYYLRSYDVAKAIVSEEGTQKNLKIMLDTFHMQMLGGNLTATIDKIAPLTGHVQISQAPSRNCPLVGGEINYPYILKHLSNKWSAPIGLEYNSHSSESFSWLKDFDHVWSLHQHSFLSFTPLWRNRFVLTNKWRVLFYERNRGLVDFYPSLA